MNGDREPHEQTEKRIVADLFRMLAEWDAAASAVPGGDDGGEEGAA
jgi:hypothetical protein